MLEVAEIIRVTDDNEHAPFFCFFDELAGSTDTYEGSVLCKNILQDFIHKKNCTCICTTHFDFEIDNTRRLCTKMVDLKPCYKIHDKIIENENLEIETLNLLQKMDFFNEKIYSYCYS